MKDWIILMVLAGGILPGCGRQPPAFAPPPQRVDPGGRDPGELGNYISLGDPYAAEYIVRDITEEKSDWRWTLVRPELKVTAHRSTHLTFRMEFAVPPVTLRRTGPIQVTCFVDGKSLGPMRVEKAGQYRYERPVPDGWVKAGVPVSIAAEVDKRYVAEADGVQLSFLLHAAGLVE